MWQLVGGSQREDNVELLEERIKAEDLDMSDFEWYTDLRVSMVLFLTQVSGWDWSEHNVFD